MARADRRRVEYAKVLPDSKAATRLIVSRGSEALWRNRETARLFPRPGLALALARFLSYMEDTTGALYAFVVMVFAPGLLVFLMAQSSFMRGLTAGATKG